LSCAIEKNYTEIILKNKKNGWGGIRWRVSLKLSSVKVVVK
jgi:hypothetical protein